MCVWFTFTGESSEYRVNGKQVTLAKYTRDLEKIGIVVKAKNCLVYQVLLGVFAVSHKMMSTNTFVI